MKKWSKDKKKVVAIASSMLAAIGFLTGSLIFEADVNRWGVREYVPENLPKLMRKQEKILELKHYGLPQVSFEAPSENFFYQTVAGSYNSATDTIYLPLGKNPAPDNLLAKIISFGTARTIDEVLYHELGHYFMDKLNESKGRGDWNSNAETFAETLGKKIIS